MSINFEYLNQIEGWLDPRAMIFSNYLKNYYLKDSFDSLEIGIHHGKFFLGLENITPKENIAFAMVEGTERSQQNARLWLAWLALRPNVPKAQI